MDIKMKKLILLNFLKTGFSTRKLDVLLGLSSVKSKGWNSWDILKEFKLEDKDKGKLFLYSIAQCNELIKEIISKSEEGKVDNFILNNDPSFFKMYQDKFVLAKSPADFYSMFTGETRNITQGFFLANKNLIGICQFKNCYETRLESAHYRSSRPKIFIRSAKANDLGFLEGTEYKKYDVNNTIKDYLLNHRQKNSLCFLCKKHHTELDRLKGRNKRDVKRYKKAHRNYKKLIETNIEILYNKKTNSKPTELKPLFPIGFNLKRINKTGLVISWGENPNTDGYILKRNSIEIYEGRDLKFYDKDFLPNTVNEYELIAYNKYGNSDVSTLTIEKL